MTTCRNALKQSHAIMAKHIREGDLCVDATVGNGYDTLFLAELVGESGKVIAFDIQISAIDITRERLASQNLLHRVQLILAGHENMEAFVKEEIHAVMFNLGYRPGGDHTIGTTFETTKKALQAAMKLLKKGGLISLVVYYGGDSGFEEKINLLEYIKTINSKEFIVLQSEYVNQSNCPPLLVLIEKL